MLVLSMSMGKESTPFCFDVMLWGQRTGARLSHKGGAKELRPTEFPQTSQVALQDLWMRLIFPKTGIFKSGVYHTCIRNANLFSLRAGKIHSILTEKAKKPLTAGDRRGIVSSTCERGFFLLPGCGVRGADPSTCGAGHREAAADIHRILWARFRALWRWIRQETGRIRRFLYEKRTEAPVK